MSLEGKWRKHEYLCLGSFVRNWQKSFRSNCSKMTLDCRSKACRNPGREYVHRGQDIYKTLYSSQDRRKLLHSRYIGTNRTRTTDQRQKNRPGEWSTHIISCNIRLSCHHALPLQDLAWHHGVRAVLGHTFGVKVNEAGTRIISS